MTIPVLCDTVRSSEHRLAGTVGTIQLGVDGRFRVTTHLRDLDIVVRRDTGDSDEQAGHVDRGKGVVKDDAGGRDSDDLLEDAADA